MIAYGQLDGSYEKLRSITHSQGGEEYPAYSRRKVGWGGGNLIGHILRRNCQRVIEGNVEG